MPDYSQRDPKLEPIEYDPIEVKETARLFKECLDKAADGSLRNRDINGYLDLKSVESKRDLNFHLENIGGPQTIGYTDAIWEGLKELARILTDIQKRIDFCQHQIESNEVENNPFRDAIIGNKKLPPDDPTSLPLREVIQTYARPEAFKTTWLKIEQFEAVLDYFQPIAAKPPKPIFAEIKTRPKGPNLRSHPEYN